MTNSVTKCGLCVAAAMTFAGCAYQADHWREDGPSSRTEWESPSAIGLRAQYQASPDKNRGWDQQTLSAADGRVVHGVLWFEDPFVDKGHGRTDETHPHNVHHFGWEDVVAGFYVYPRYWLNLLGLPASVVVTPPWALLESDGKVSKQALGYDHDATTLGSEGPPPEPIQTPADEASQQPAPAETTAP